MPAEHPHANAIWSPPCRSVSSGRAWTGAMAILLAAAIVSGGPPPATVPATTQAIVVPTPTSFFIDQIAALEADLAALLQRKPDLAGPDLAMVDLQIDLRLIQRWILFAAIDAKTNDELNGAAAVRVINLQSAGAQLGQRLQNSGKALTPGQLEGLAKLHQLTYKLPEVKKGNEIDDTCQTVARALILAANPTAEEVKHLPPMRPTPIPGPAPRPPPVARTLDELTARAKRVQVGAPLRRQLGVIARMAAEAAADPKAQDDAKLAYDMVGAAVDLSDGLEKSTGIDAIARPKIEQQLTEGLALFSDARTRTAGRRRIAALSQYRETLLRVQNLHLPAALQQKLAPAFLWINNNPETGGKVLELIEAYLQLCERHDSHKPFAALPLNWKKSVDALRKQFAAQRSGFVDDAAALGGAGIIAPDPASLTVNIASMRQILDSIDLIEKLPRAIQVLTVYRPRPGGALDKRAVLAVTDLTSPAATGLRDVSAKFLADVERLALTAEGAMLPTGLSPEIKRAYMHGRTESVESHRFTLISDLASQLAAGKDLDNSDLAKVQTLRDMFDSLRLASDVEVALTRADSLMRWADWSISPAQLKALVVPYREATVAAFEGFASDNATPLFRWPDVHRRFLPILVLIKGTGAYAGQCNDLPAGLFGEYAKLLTPMDNQPFAAERAAGLSVGIWQHAAEGADPKTAEAAFDAMLGRLRKELRISEE